MDSPNKDSRLNARLGFSDYDLVENRAGRLSTGQKLDLKRHADRNRLIFWVLVVVNVLMMIALFSYPGFEGVPRVLCMGFMGFLFVAWLFMGRGEDRQARNDITGGKVDTFEGTVKTVMVEAEDGFDYVVELGNRAFRGVSRDAYEAFQPERRYRVYYLGNRILSVEPAE